MYILEMGLEFLSLFSFSFSEQQKGKQVSFAGSQAGVEREMRETEKTGVLLPLSSLPLRLHSLLLESLSCCFRDDKRFLFTAAEGKVFLFAGLKREAKIKRRLSFDFLGIGIGIWDFMGILDLEYGMKM